MINNIVRSSERKLDQVIRIAKLYYEQGLSQGEIAEREFISKSSVCRLLQIAKESKIVTFRVNYPVVAMAELEKEIKDFYDLENVRIAPTYTEDMESRLNDTCKLIVNDLYSILQTDDILAVGWGRTMESLSRVLQQNVPERACSKIVLMNGSLAGNINSIKSSAIVETMANHFLAEGYFLPVPLIVDSEETMRCITADSHVKYVLEYAREAEIALFSLGAVSNDSVLTQRGAYSEEEYQKSIIKGAVGDVAGRFFDQYGQAVCTGTEERVIGLTIDEIKKKRKRIAVAVGESKVKAILGSLRGGIINCLYTDERTALALQEQQDKTTNSGQYGH
jgi:deoxyribonucleoside regulator